MTLPLLLCALAAPLFGAPAQDPVWTGAQDAPGVRATVPLPASALEFRVHDVAAHVGAASLESLLDDLADTRDPAEVRALMRRVDRHLELAQQVRERTEDLIEGLQAFVDPPLTGEQHLVDLGDGRLGLFGTAEQQAWVTSFLGAAGGLEGGVLVSTRIVRLPHGSLQELGIQRTGSTLDPARAQRLLEELERISPETLAAPRVMVRPLQSANLYMGEQTAYIRDYQLQVLEDSEVADPVIDVVNAGLDLDLRAARLADGRLALDLDLTLSDLVELTAHEMPLGVSGAVVTVQTPELKVVRASSLLLLRPGDTALLASVGEAGEDEVLVWIEAEVVELPDEPVEPLPLEPLPAGEDR